MPNIALWLPPRRSDFKPRYIYVLSDPRTKIVRYVGMSVDPKARKQSHGNAVATKPMRTWIANLRRIGLSPEMRVVERCPNKKIGALRERLWIEHWYGIVGHELLNRVHNGDFVPVEVIERRAKKLREAIDAEQARRINNARARIVRPNGKRYTAHGQTMTISQWSAHLGISRQRVHQRLKKMPVDEALSKPKQTA